MATSSISRKCDCTDSSLALKSQISPPPSQPLALLRPSGSDLLEITPATALLSSTLTKDSNQRKHTHSLILVTRTRLITANDMKALIKKAVKVHSIQVSEQVAQQK